MTYQLGVDLGTTYTAAAVHLGERVEILDLGTRSSAIPSVVYLREDGSVLTGEAALRRGASDPTRLSREFKRRMGDSTAILLGGTPYSVDALMASMLRTVVTTATERHGGPPSAVTIAHPANWGQYKRDLLDQAVRRADLRDATLITEPQAAAIHYATLERLEPGATIAVYDLGGGTFDAATLRTTADGFELLGEPEGIERLGGIDFDEAVFRHVIGAIGSAFEELDPDDPVAQAAVSRLRDECVAAKEALSGDTEVSIPVILPTVNTEVRLTRAEFEAMLRPALADTLIVLARSIRSAGLEPADLHSILLVGGSSRIPLISQMVSAEFARPVAVDVHPKHSIALGAATVAGRDLVVESSTAGAAAVTGLDDESGTGQHHDEAAQPQPAAEHTTNDVARSGTGAPVGDPPPAPASVPQAPVPQAADETARIPATADDGSPPPPPAATAAGTSASPGGSSKVLAIAAAVIVLAVAAGVGLLVLGGGDDSDTAAGEVAATTEVITTTPQATTPQATTPQATTAEATTTTTATTTTIADTCAGVAEPCIRVADVRANADGTVQVTWEAVNFVPDAATGFHAHLYWNTGTAAQASSDSADQIPWEVSQDPIHTGSQVLIVSEQPPGATGVCATVGLAPGHAAVNPALFDCRDLSPT